MSASLFTASSAACFQISKGQECAHLPVTP